MLKVQPSAPLLLPTVLRVLPKQLLHGLSEKERSWYFFSFYYKQKVLKDGKLESKQTPQIRDDCLMTLAAEQSATN